VGVCAGYSTDTVFRSHLGVEGGCEDEEDDFSDSGRGERGDDLGRYVELEGASSKCLLGRLGESPKRIDSLRPRLDSDGSDCETTIGGGVLMPSGGIQRSGIGVEVRDEEEGADPVPDNNALLLW